MDNFALKTLKLGQAAFHSLTFQLKFLDFQSNQYKKLAPVLSRFCNGLLQTAWSLAVLLETVPCTVGLVNKVTDQLLKSNLDKSGLDITSPKVKGLEELFDFLLYIITR